MQSLSRHLAVPRGPGSHRQKNGRHYLTQTLARNGPAPSIEQVLIGGDLSALTEPQRLAYYMNLCDSLKLNHLTKPFDYLRLNGRLILYANKTATDQLRDIRKVSITR